MTSVRHVYYAVKVNPRIRNTLPSVPRQTRPRMVVMSFRLPVDVRDKLYAKAEADGLNPTEVVRSLVADYAKGDDQ